MKKVQLFTASIYAMAMCACAQGQFEDYDLRQENYTRAFIKEFGVYDPGHDWGFTVAPASRAVDVNGNEWINPPAVTAEEEELVMAYLKQPISNIKTQEGIDYTDYFVTQVGASHDTIRAGNGSIVVGSNNMDNLHILESTNGNLENLNYGSGTNWIHVNNFNASANSNYGGNTVMYDSGSVDFAYYSSIDSKYHNRYIIVNGHDIDPSLSPYYWYVCFDFDSHYGVQTYFKVYYEYMDQNGHMQKRDREVLFDDVYCNGEQPSHVAFLQALRQLDSSIPENAVITEAYFTRFEHGNMLVEGDGIYDDWVVRIVGNAVRVDDPTKTPEYPTPDNPYVPNTQWRRVMAEDLSIQASYDINNVSKSDWDFNDIVFDAYIDAHGKAQLRIQALGGTYPVFIGDAYGNLTKELHAYYNESSSTMINTGMGKDLGPREITADLKAFSFDPTDYRSIKIFVKDGNSLEELKAETGSAPSKICTPAAVDWSYERQHITEKYANFTDWVKDQNNQFWTIQ